MADLRGEQLKDSYQNVVTRGTGNKLENGNGVEFADLDDKASLSSTTLDISTDPNFTSGSIILKRSGDIVSLSVSGTIEHPDSSDITSDAGFLPSEWRPAHEQGNVYSFNIAGSFNIRVRPDGSIRFFYTLADGTAQSRTSTTTPVSITYNL